MVLIVVAVALAATLNAQTAARNDLGPIGDSLGQSVTRDGRYSTQTSDLGVHLVDLATGRSNLIVSARSSSKRLRFPQYASAIAPDGKLIAFDRFNGTRSELVLIDNQGRGERVLLNADGVEFLPADWSADGHYLLISTAAHMDRRSAGCHWGTPRAEH